MRVDDDAMELMTHYSAGFPRLMHLVGDNAFWMDKDGVISAEDALNAVIRAADDIGKKHVDTQVYRALQSKDYQSILRKMATSQKYSMVFETKEIAKGLTESEKKKLNNFLQRMKKLRVIRAGEIPGQYIFNSRMVHLYIRLKETSKSASA